LDEEGHLGGPGGDQYEDVTADVRVFADDYLTVTLEDGFEYLLTTPTIDDISPDVGAARGNRDVTIFGSDFWPNVSVKFETSPAANIRRIFPTAIDHSAAGNPAAITTVTKHKLQVGDIVYISGHTGAIPSLDGPHAVATVPDELHFTIPTNVTTGGTGGSIDEAINLKTPQHGTGEMVTVRVRNVDRQFADVNYTYDYPDPPLRIVGVGPVRREGPPISISDELNDAPNSCTLTVGMPDGSDPAMMPAAGQNTEIYIEDYLVFGGTVQSVDRLTLEGSDRIWQLQLTDYIWELNRRRPFGNYVDISATTVLIDLITTYASSFSAAGVQGGLPTVTILLNGETDLAAVISQIMESIGGWWYPSYQRIVFARTVAITTDPPDPIDDDNTTLLLDPPITLRTDISQVRTRVWVEYQGGVVAVNDTAAQAYMASIEGGSGIHEDKISVDTADVSRAVAAGVAWLDKWSKPAISLSYSTLDYKTRSGKTVHVDLTEPPISGDFLIQSMQMSRIHDTDSDTFFAACQVSASLVQSPVTKFNFNDLLRRVLLTAPGRGSVVSVGSGVGGPFLPLSGSQAMTGDLDAGGNLVRGVSDPILADDAATKGYVDAQIAALGSVNVYDASLTNGDPDAPEIVFDSNGDVVTVTGIPL
jgi:IPT/TIG domain